MTATVPALGTPSQDGALGIIRVGVGAAAWEELLVWNLAQQVWVGRPRVALSMTDQYSLQFPAAAGVGAWKYLSLVTDVATQFVYGTQLRIIPHAADLWAAGLRLQELVSGHVWGDGNGVPLAALNWYELNPGDEISQLSVAGNIGVQLAGDAAVKRYVSSGWQNSPIAAPAKAVWYPDLYVAKQSGINGHGQVDAFTARYRWAGGPGLGGAGGADTIVQPPVTDQLAYWWVADNTGGVDGTPIDTWVDESGNGRLLTQAAAGKQPLTKRNVLNGKAVARFDGVDDFLQRPGSLFAQPNTLLIVLKQYAGGAAQQVWVDGIQNGNRMLLYRFDGVDQVSMYAGGADQAYHRAAAWPSGFVCFNAIYNGAASALWENKTQKLAAVNPGADALLGLTLGAIANGTIQAQVDIAEILVYNKALNDADRNSVIDWLNTKYALF